MDFCWMCRQTIMGTVQFGGVPGVPLMSRGLHDMMSWIKKKLGWQYFFQDDAQKNYIDLVNSLISADGGASQSELSSTTP